MAEHYVEMALRLGAAVAVSAAIGLERDYHGRPAGFRTHVLVSLCSALLMLASVHARDWVPMDWREPISFDPTRMAQGIMTGIGFLGAGAIIKEGLTVRGLTTAASLWITAGLGILAGVGLYFPLALGGLATFAVLLVFYWIEKRVPGESFVTAAVRFPDQSRLPEPELRRVIADSGFTIKHVSYRLNDAGRVFEYGLILRTLEIENAGRLAEALRAQPSVLAFRVEPGGVSPLED